jgi:hypothetical protein
MSMTNALQIKVAVVTKVLDRSIIAMNNKYYIRLSSKIMPMQIDILNM